MKYGFCTGVASTLTEVVDYKLVRQVKAAGYDYVELPLMLVAALSDAQFAALLLELEQLGLGCDCCSNLFPKSIRVVGPEVNPEKITAYLQRAFERAARLKTKKIVFGSAPSRQLPEGWTQEAGYRQLTQLIQEVLLPLCRKYGILIVMEPLRGTACNFINTLPDGMEIVRRVDSPYVTLLADSIHMLSEREDPNHIIKYFESLDHVHISEADRVLPEAVYSGEVQAILERLKGCGYDKTISFETKCGQGPESPKKALDLLKAYFAV
jgi:D-psicose/D-tagatose/L-ribulose 3-epimerase